MFFIFLLQFYQISNFQVEFFKGGIKPLIGLFYFLSIRDKIKLSILIIFGEEKGEV